MNLINFNKGKKLNQRLAHQLAILNEFDFIMLYRPGKYNYEADYLSGCLKKDHLLNSENVQKFIKPKGISDDRMKEIDNQIGSKNKNHVLKHFDIYYCQQKIKSDNLLNEKINNYFQNLPASKFVNVVQNYVDILNPSYVKVDNVNPLTIDEICGKFKTVSTFTLQKKNCNLQMYHDTVTHLLKQILQDTLLKRNEQQIQASEHKLLQVSDQLDQKEEKKQYSPQFDVNKQQQQQKLQQDLDKRKDFHNKQVHQKLVHNNTLQNNFIKKICAEAMKIVDIEYVMKKKRFDNYRNKPHLRIPKLAARHKFIRDVESDFDKMQACDDNNDTERPLYLRDKMKLVAAFVYEKFEKQIDELDDNQFENFRKLIIGHFTTQEKKNKEKSVVSHIAQTVMTIFDSKKERDEQFQNDDDIPYMSSDAEIDARHRHRH